MDLSTVLYIVKALILGSIFFVWVVRYENIIEEFKYYGLSESIRDFVGILKLSSTVMLFSSDPNVVKFGAATIFFLMIAAVLTHLRSNNPVFKMLPSFTLMLLNLFVFFTTA